jgi:YHS domain-containing protein
MVEKRQMNGYFMSIRYGGFIMKLSTKSTNTVIDPVCGMLVDPCKTELIADYKGSRFYFCAAGCLKTFEKEPEKYQDPKSDHKKGWWGRYLSRLNKATDGKSMKCH